MSSAVIAAPTPAAQDRVLALARRVLEIEAAAVSALAEQLDAGFVTAVDLILASTAVAGDCRAVRIDREMRKRERPSDHAPVMAEFAPTPSA